MSRPANATAAAPARFGLSESPVWSAREQRLYWIDVRAPELWRLDPVTGATESWRLPEVVGAVMLRAAGGVVLGLKSGLFLFDPDTQALGSLLPVDEGYPENRLNDSKCDRQGRLWFSTMWDFAKQTSGSLYRLSAALELETVRTQVTVPNAVAFSPEGDTIYFTDTRKPWIEAAPLDVATGAVGAWRNLAGSEGVPGLADGATVDAEGYLWNARFGAGLLARFAPDGRLDRLVSIPAAQPTSCAFGGAGLDTLYVTTANRGMSEADLEANPLAGAILAVDVGVRGIAEPEFAG